MFRGLVLFLTGSALRCAQADEGLPNATITTVQLGETSGGPSDAAAVPGFCRCRAGQSCFDAAPWGELAGLGVRVGDVEPLDRSVLLTLTAEHDPLWLSSQPGGTHHSGAMGSPRIPGWMITNSTPSKFVTISDALEASQALRFATKHHIAVVVKNTGHDWGGRSVSPGSLMLWTHKMNTIEWHEDFTPLDCGSSAGSAVTVGAGVQFHHLYEQAFVQRRYVVGGTCLSVGIVGCTLGGCYGDASRMYGSAATNLLEAEVVLASGEVVTANKCGGHADLFKAIRGGGGAFGLVTKATYRTFPEISHEAGLFGKLRGGPVEGLVRFLAWYAEVVREGQAKHFGGILFISSSGVNSLINANGLELSRCKQISKPLGLPCQSWSISWPPKDAWRSPHAEGIVDAWEKNFSSSYRTESLTRYFMLDHIRTDAQRQRFSKIVAHIAMSLPPHRHIVLSLNYVLGHSSSVALEDAADTSVHPDVMTAVGSLKIDFTTHYKDLPGDAASDSFPINQQAWTNLEFVRGKLDMLLPAAGSYYNEADYTEEQWQSRFWGSNYAELLRTKRKYDPDNVFTCHHCVGSEEAGAQSGCGRRLGHSAPVWV
mmetsp:Transcript_69489/g.175184  ORF Transcript_69489/g.175184 Transcript_69489/m.175184 type:complete len:597 (+) Transcript_69489:63-1853(+)